MESSFARSCLECALCWGRGADGDGRYAELDESDDQFLWSHDLGAHSAGEFSHAVAQAYPTIEDHSVVEVADGAIFVGVYDGHGGDAASRFVRDELFARFNRLAKEKHTIDEDVLKEAFAETEAEFLNVVRNEKDTNPGIKSVGSCCLAGVIWRGSLYVANAGDSRVVIGRTCPSGGIYAEQLTKDDNCRLASVRAELKATHPDDHGIVYRSKGSWRIRGIIQVSKSIGDAFLKDQEFAFPRGHGYHFNQQLTRPSLSAIPTVFVRNVQRNDQFLIFASDGLWDVMTNATAVKIVRDNPRQGIARRLILEAVKEVRRNNLGYDNRHGGNKLGFHDDISVVVVFMDTEAPSGQERPACDPVRLIGFANGPEPGTFDLEEIH